MHKILIVDDSRSVLMALRSQIDSSQFSVATAQSAAEAWLLLEKNAFDCVLTDFEMPDTNGADFCRRIKMTDRLAHIPVIMITSLDHIENLLMAIDAGADDFISKDSDMRLIIAKIRAMVRIKKTNEELRQLRRVEAIKQIIATYNHEFNNPLSIAIGNINWLKKNCSDANQMTRIDRLLEALGRMGELVKKIRELRDYVETSYAGREGMIDIDSTGTKRAS